MRLTCHLVFALMCALGAIGTVRGGAGYADPVAGEYTLGLALADGQVPVGGETELHVSIERSDRPPYQFAQWFVGYDPAIVQVTLVEPAALAPAACDEMISSPFRVLLGCRDRFGPTIAFSGIAYVVSLRCLAPGETPFVLRFASGPDAHRTFVRTSGGDINEPIHTHDALLTCGEDAAGPTPTFQPLRTATLGARTMTAVAQLSATPIPATTLSPARPATAPPAAPTASRSASAMRPLARTRVPARTATTVADVRPADDDDSSSAAFWAIIGAAGLGAGAVAAVGGWWWAKRR